MDLYLQLPSYLLLLSLTCLPECWPQSTQPRSSCSFVDDENVFNIEVLRGTRGAPCSTSSDVTDQLKATEDRLSEAVWELQKLQTQVLQLMDANLNISEEVHALEAELRATQYVLRPTIPVLATCPPPYHEFWEEKKSCYLFGTRSLTWFNAESFCQSTGGHLVAIETEEEQQYLINYIRNSLNDITSHFWTGGNDIAAEGRWSWAGSSAPLNYTDWLTYPHPADPDTTITQPDDDHGEEHCMHMFYLFDFAWNDGYCLNQHYFICEMKTI